MSPKQPMYENYFKVGQQVKISIHQSETKYREYNGELIFIRDDRCRVEILGEGLPADFSAKGSVKRISFSGWSGWGFFRCDAILEDISSDIEIGLRLVGHVEEKQRREYFRLDVFIPVHFSVPAEQHMNSIEAQWKENKEIYRKSPAPEMIFTGRGYRVVTMNGLNIAPENVNLSGGGLRVRRPSFLPEGTKINADLFLPVAPTRAICTVAEVIRSNELKLRIDKDPSFITAMKFLFIDEKDRESIIAYLFAEQRNILQTDIDRGLPSPRSPESR